MFKILMIDTKHLEMNQSLALNNPLGVVTQAKRSHTNNFGN